MAQAVEDDQLKAEIPSNMIGLLILTLTAGLVLSRPQFPDFGSPTLNVQVCESSNCNQNNPIAGLLGLPSVSVWPSFGRRKRSLAALDLDGGIPFSQLIHGLGPPGKK